MHGYLLKRAMDDGEFLSERRHEIGKDRDLYHRYQISQQEFEIRLVKHWVEFNKRKIR